MTGDNVIPFPARPEPGNSGLPDPADVARQLLAAGHSPASLVSALGGLGASWFEPPRLQAPTLLPRRDRPARYTIRVDLDGAKPPIWRRITVSSALGLERLHAVLQAAMGWTNSHLHAFRVASGVRDYSVQPFLTAFDIEEGDEGTAEADVRLDEVLGSVGDRLVYEYDFGDGWDHLLKLEKIEEVADGETVEAHVIGGRRACPPEDVGGIYTYNDLVVALNESGEVEQWLQDRIDWLPDGFDPAAFDLAEADADTENAGAGRLPRSIPFSHPEFVDLMLKLGPYGPLAELAAEAVSGPTELSVDELAGAMRPLLALLDLVGEQAVDLTGAGYVKPALVRQVAVETGIAKTWIGSMSREESTPRVAYLRRTARALGLLRKYRGRLLLTNCPVGVSVGCWGVIEHVDPSMAAGIRITNHAPHMWQNKWRSSRQPARHSAVGMEQLGQGGAVHYVGVEVVEAVGSSTSRAGILGRRSSRSGQRVLFLSGESLQIVEPAQ